MKKSFCENGHCYDIWYLNAHKRMVYRKCIKCGFIRKLPKTKEVIQEINKQRNASKELVALEKVIMKQKNCKEINLLKGNILECLKKVLNNINYLSYSERAYFNEILKKIKKCGYIDSDKVNSQFLDSLIYSSSDDNNEDNYQVQNLFYDGNELSYIDAKM